MTKEELLKLKNEGLTYQQIGDKYGLSRQRVHQIITDYNQRPEVRARQKAYNQRPEVIKRKIELLQNKLKEYDKN